MANVFGYRARRSVAIYRIGWGSLQGLAGVLLLAVRASRVRLPPHSSIRLWLRTMIWDNTFIDQIHFGSSHFTHIPFRVEQGIWMLLGFAVLNITFGWMILRVPFWARWIGTVVFGFGWIAGGISLFLHLTWFRVALTLIDIVFFIYFVWIFPRHLVQEALLASEVPVVDKIIENA